ncbi:MAG: DUF2442 domain-containing protein [Eubacterium sp.]|nr:DUF2442 domain-containing protein [Eubacterium sp.]
MELLPKIIDVKALDNYILEIVFDDDKKVHYDMKEDMKTLPNYYKLSENNLFKKFEVDESGGCIVWSEEIDLPSDILYEYGVEVK